MTAMSAAELLAVLGDGTRMDDRPLPTITFGDQFTLMGFIRLLEDDLGCPSETLRVSPRKYMYDGIELSAAATEIKYDGVVVRDADYNPWAEMTEQEWDDYWKD